MVRKCALPGQEYRGASPGEQLLPRFAVSVGLAIALVACSSPTPVTLIEPDPGDVDVVNLGLRPVYRLWGSPSMTGFERKAERDDVYKELLFPDPSPIVLQMEPGPDGRLPLAQMIRGISDINNVYQWGILIESLVGEVIHYIPVGPGNETKRIPAFPDGQDPTDVLIKTVRSVKVTVLPMLAQPAEFRSPPLHLPVAASLRLSISTNPIAKGPLAFRVDAITDESRETLFREVVEPDSNTVWRTYDIELPRTDAKPLVLAFTSENIYNEPSFANPLWGDVYVYRTDRSDMPRRPNVLLISLDTLRADRLGLYGFDGETSPNLDAFGAESVVFDRCIAPSSWTVPSHAAVFTGLHPVAHPRDVDKFEYALVPETKTLAEYARDMGYLTAGMTEGLAVGGRYGFAQGFGSYAGWPGPGPLQRSIIAERFDAAFDWMLAHREAPFFFFLHTYQIHAPYAPPEPFRSRFYVGNLESVNPGIDPDTPAAREACEPLYLGEIAFTDHVLGEFLDRLRNNGFLDNTLIVIFSDHGEEFMEHGGFGHGMTLFDEVLHVPLLIRFPGAAGPIGRIERTVGLVDVFATVMDFIGAPPQTPTGSKSLLGLSGWPSHSPPYSRKLTVSQLKQLPREYVLLSAENDRWKYILAANVDTADSPVSDAESLLEAGGSIDAQLLERYEEMPSEATVTVANWQYESRVQQRDMLIALDDDSPAQNPSQTDPIIAALRASLKMKLDRVLLKDVPWVGVSPESAYVLTPEDRRELEAVGYF